MTTNNLHRIQQAIDEACALSNRPKGSVRLVAVTKSVDSTQARSLLEQGVQDCAENRVDKLLEKKQALSDFPDVNWHLIGNLQRRKVKLIINEIDYFHALDSLSLAAEVDKRATKVIKCFVEVNVSGESTKHGLAPDEVIPFIHQLSVFEKVQVVGLMTMAPFEASNEEIRGVFRELKNIQGTVQSLALAHAPCGELSMGMSNDFEIAIQEGATFVRIGSALFKDV